MNLTALHSQLQQKKLDNFYIFYGDEIEIQKRYVEQIIKISGLKKYIADSVLDVYKRLKHKTIIQSVCCYAVFNDIEFLTAEGLWDNIQSVLGNNILIVRMDTVDKRTKFYKRFENKIVEFESLSDSVLQKYIKQLITLSDNNCQQLIEICEHNYGRLLLEIDKIKRYTNYLGPAPLYDGVFQKLLQDGTIYKSPQDVIFDLVDAILNRSTEMFSLYKESIQSGEAVFVILTVLYNSTRALLQVQSCGKKSDKDIMKITGLSYPQLQGAKSHFNRYSIEELLKLLEYIRKAETGIKNGTIEEQFAIDYVLMEVLC